MSPAVQRLCNGTLLPVGTLAVNMIGCFVIGFLAQLAESKGIFQGEVRAFLFVGVLGGYTTFSSFGYETFQLIRDGEIAFAIANSVLQVVLGLILVWLGWILGRIL